MAFGTRINHNLLHTDGEAPAIKYHSSKFSPNKRSRSPPSPHINQVVGCYSTDDNERELQAKTKRMARFKGELDQTIPNDIPIFDKEGLKSSTVIVGLCPDMCPESERSERERKGDLDQYERLDGDRNQTSHSLAIKKYTRTAEREAHLIRPMPVLVKTFDYLMSLLDQPYGDERFISIYNFLWDRMRAIRMDLRMQHMFNLEAISMLEKMIRLHILAMHELCEFTKGEGFSEGFDAHLNIEQMNKTSVELFQMYDDHRKNGVNVPTEREFRGYYALLKLDKHPGYKVEPAELSLDLAKMSKEIRRTPEVVFARDVARASRAGNFISFFRLARKASYLQACLMHAHFAKLRTQALASLHSGLQNNQGLPVADLSNWLGIDHEDVLSLLEYHGFLIKEFEEPYMVRNGAFLNADQDFLTRCSKLVQLKQSKKIVEDVSLFCEAVSSPAAELSEDEICTVSYLPRKDEYGFRDNGIVIYESSVPSIDEEISKFENISYPRDNKQLQPLLGASAICQQKGADPNMSDLPEFVPDEITRVNELNHKMAFETERHTEVDCYVEAAPLQIASSSSLLDISSSSQFDPYLGNSEFQREVPAVNDVEEAPTHSDGGVEHDEYIKNYFSAKAAEAKLKLILRIWKKRTSKRIETRKRREVEANAALGLLCMGPAFNKKKEEPGSYGVFDIDRIMRERYQQHLKSWLRVNVSEVIVEELIRINPDTECLCWKIILHSQVIQNEENAASKWLLSKLMPAIKIDNNNDDDNGGLVISSPGLSIWRKWVFSTCCLSIVRDAYVNVSNETTAGANAVLFLISETIPLELQKTNLHNLLQTLPSGSCVPLLVVSPTEPHLSCNLSDVLGLDAVEEDRVSSFSIVFLNDQMKKGSNVFFSDEKLREGLRWLARHSRPQPHLRRVKTRQLVLSHLNPFLKMLENMSLYEVGPNHCIIAFNKALDRSASEIENASSCNWPCREFLLLRASSSDEMKDLCSYFLDMGFNSETFVQALQSCKLPLATQEIPWLGHGCSTNVEAEEHVTRLEAWLVRFLTELTKMLGVFHGRNEARLMVQRSTRLELHGSKYYIVPMWVVIFRRIFHWRLMSFGRSDSPFSVCYVLGSGISSCEEEDDCDPVECVMVRPCLDEMIGIGFNHASNQFDREEEVSRTEIETFSEKMVPIEEISADMCDGGGEDFRSDFVMGDRGLMEISRLDGIVERCVALQNEISEKLSIYF